MDINVKPKTIFAGRKVFAAIKECLGVIYGCTEIRHCGVTYMLDERAGENTLHTCDPELSKFLERVEKQIYRDRKGGV
ncbi:hypothetical protein [Shewanella halifaxensis]|uniref:hypothetical protein n=1 Tax=Shewanella halifaxensis TaxID=271098 RepID=UPI000D593688|nr:hypothetical protein [Shewanella halifaxensis]